MKKTFKIEIKIKKCDTIFKEGLDKGVIGSLELTYDLDRQEYERPGFALNLMNEARELRDDIVEYQVTEEK
jgi:hypothetical protein